MSAEYITIVVENPRKKLGFNKVEKLLRENVSAISKGDCISENEQLQAQLDEAKELLSVSHYIIARESGDPLRGSEHSYGGTCKKIREFLNPPIKEDE